MTIELHMPDIQGLDVLRERLNDPVLFRAAVRDVMAQARRQGLAAAKGELEGTGKGDAVRTLFGEYSPVHARIWTIMGRANALSIEAGRTPGNAPALRGLARWATAVGHPSANNKRELVRLWWEVESRGTKGKHYMQAARRRIMERLPAWLERAGDRIVKRLAGRAS